MFAPFASFFDSHKCRYNTKLGIYKEGCGIENVIMSWGHDEYLYHVSSEGHARRNSYPMLRCW